MKKNVSVVIGANYGDEGKGLVTDYLSDPNTLVVRFNGGAQAGHTVVTPDGNRHVFHHFGSGTFAGAATFLSPFFIVNPIFYGRELAELRAKKVEPKVMVDPDCIVTTPFDMLLNEAVERKRGTARHGSCGFGINETVVRNEDPAFGITYQMFEDKVELRNRLLNIRSNYMPKRVKALGITEEIPHQWSEALIENYLDDAVKMRDHAKTVKWSAAAHEDWDNLVFEGAQGLRLDMDGPDFPHVTRSKTGLTNALLLCASGDITTPLDAYYLTRTYLTRHGAGPLRHEQDRPIYSGIVDETNVPNPHQGSLRFAVLDLDDLHSYIDRDLAQPTKLQVRPTLVISCVDQLDAGMISVIDGGEGYFYPFPTLLNRILRNHKSYLLSYGQTRLTVMNPVRLDNRKAV